MAEPMAAATAPGSAGHLSEIESVIAGIWAEVLGVPQVGLHENFFDLGGHSVLLHMVSEQLRDRFGFCPPLMELFRCPTVGSLATRFAGPARPEPAGATPTDPLSTGTAPTSTEPTSTGPAARVERLDARSRLHARSARLRVAVPDSTTSEEAARD